METTTATFLTPDALLKHWQGHRGLTRRVIEAFPEKDLYNFSIGGMRTFFIQAMEIIDLTNPGIDGLTGDKWISMEELPHISEKNLPETKADLLALWDETTDKLNRFWSLLEPRFSDSVKAFGMYEGTVYSTITYFIDNEIHHRGQGYVYLRAIGIAPPPFWDR